MAERSEYGHGRFRLRARSSRVWPYIPTSLIDVAASRRLAAVPNPAKSRASANDAPPTTGGSTPSIHPPEVAARPTRNHAPAPARSSSTPAERNSRERRNPHLAVDAPHRTGPLGRQQTCYQVPPANAHRGNATPLLSPPQRQTLRTTMPTKRTDHSTGTTPETGQPPKRKTIPAGKVGLSLTIRPKALKEFDRIQEETIKAAEKDQKFSWR